MPINAYTGLMGSGKSFECVRAVIIPAICSGRTVVTNVDGIDGDAIRAYCHDKFNIPLDRLGTVRHCANADVGKPDFLPHGTDVDTFCHAGDMVCIDEAWRFWGTDCKLLAEHKIFFREHRHYVHPETKVTCDLVLMVQDISDLHRVLKVVVELTFRTTKVKSLGLSKTYRVEMWEGYKLTKKGRSSVENKNYDPAIFPLYSSYEGGKGTEKQIDDRQNLLKNKTLWLLCVFVIVVFALAVYGLSWFFGGGMVRKSSPEKSAPIRSNASASEPQKSSAASTDSAPFRDTSDLWRIAGRASFNGSHHVVLVDSAGRLRFESPSLFQLGGSLMVGDVDQQRVTFYSGTEYSNSRGAK